MTQSAGPGLFDAELEETWKCRWCGCEAHMDAWDCSGTDNDATGAAMAFCPACNRQDHGLSWNAEAGRFRTKDEQPSAWMIYGLLLRGQCGTMNGVPAKRKRKPKAEPAVEPAAQSLPGMKEREAVRSQPESEVAGG